MKLLLLMFITLSPAFCQGKGIKLSWVDQTQNPKARIAYSIYRQNRPCPTSITGFTKLTSGIKGTSYTDISATVGTYCYYVTSTLLGYESIASPFLQYVVSSDPNVPFSVSNLKAAAK